MNPLLLLALIPPILFNLTGMVDAVLTKQFSIDQNDGLLSDSIGTLMIIGGVIAGIVTVILFPFVLPELAINKETVLLIVSGLLYGFAVFPYFKAFESERIENIIPMLQIIPAMTYIFGVVILGEVLSYATVFIIMGIVLCSGLFARDFNAKRVNRIGLGRVFLTASLYALGFVLFKAGGGESLSLVTSFFRQHLGITIVSMVRVFKPNVLSTTITYFKTGGTLFAILNIANELLYIVGVMILGYLFLKFPVAVVETISNGIQPILGFSMARLAWKLLPKYFDREYSRVQISGKVIFSVIILILLALLFL